MDLQELISRGRFLFANAPSRFAVFNNINGRRTAKDIAAKLNRRVNSVRNDLIVIRNAEFIQEKRSSDVDVIKKEGFVVYEKVPLARTVPSKYFGSVGKRPSKGKIAPQVNRKTKGARSTKKAKPLSLPSETQILDVCDKGENQIHEFKAPGTDVNKITKVIAAMLNTEKGGIIFYGIRDSGKIDGSDKTLQVFDQSLQNSIHHNITPAAVVKIHEVAVLGNTVLVIIIPPWNRKDVFHHDNQVYIRKGTNALRAKADENRKLHDGELVF